MVAERPAQRLSLASIMSEAVIGMLLVASKFLSVNQCNYVMGTVRIEAPFLM
jgi:hypothetical protein